MHRQLGGYPHEEETISNALVFVYCRAVPLSLLNFIRMTNLVISINSSEDVRLFEELAARLGLRSYVLTEADSRLLARKELLDAMSDVHPETEIPEDLILEMVEEIRAKRHATHQSNR